LGGLGWAVNVLTLLPQWQRAGGFAEFEPAHR